MGCSAFARYPKKCDTACAIDECAGENVSFVAPGFPDCPVRESQPPVHMIADRAPATSSTSFHLCVPTNDLRTPPPNGYIRAARSSGYRARPNGLRAQLSSKLDAILNRICCRGSQSYSKSAKKVQGFRYEDLLMCNRLRCVNGGAGEILLDWIAHTLGVRGTVEIVPTQGIVPCQNAGHAYT